MTTKLIGALGEYTAARELREKGYDILSVNYSNNVGELDIVAQKLPYICFVEVKTRRGSTMFRAADAVDFHKQENIKSAAASYMNKYKMKALLRYDIYEVYIDDDDNVISTNHIENAF